MWTATARFTSPGAQVVVCPLGILNVIIYILLSVSSYSCLFDLGLHLKLSKSNKNDESKKNDKSNKKDKVTRMIKIQYIEMIQTKR